MKFVERLKEDMASFMDRDPAARSFWEVALFYPGFHAVLFHRLSHRLWQRGWQRMAKMVATLGRFFTQVEIHPAAHIGRRLVIDHGAGLVIGETARIGDDVTLYQSVTLGGIAPSRNSRSQRRAKRHPTLEKSVIVGAGAQVLGPITIGAHACIGANAVVLEDVAARTTVVGIPARTISAPKRSGNQFIAYGTMADSNGLEQKVKTLEDELSQLQKKIEKLLPPSSATAQPKTTSPPPSGVEPKPTSPRFSGRAGSTTKWVVLDRSKAKAFVTGFKRGSVPHQAQVLFDGLIEGREAGFVWEDEALTAKVYELAQKGILITVQSPRYIFDYYKHAFIDTGHLEMIIDPSSATAQPKPTSPRFSGRAGSAKKWVVLDRSKAKAFVTGFEKGSVPRQAQVLFDNLIEGKEAGFVWDDEALTAKVYELAQKGILITRQDPRYIFDYYRHAFINTGHLEMIIESSSAR